MCERPASLANAMATLSEFDSKRLLVDHGLPVLPERSVATAVEAVAAAEELGYPCVMKLSGDQIAHKTERGLVRLGLGDGRAGAEQGEQGQGGEGRAGDGRRHGRDARRHPGQDPLDALRGGRVGAHEPGAPPRGDARPTMKSDRFEPLPPPGSARRTRTTDPIPGLDAEEAPRSRGPGANRGGLVAADTVSVAMKKAPIMTAPESR